MLLNGLLLLSAVVTPFTTLLVPEHSLHPDTNLAAMIYTGSFFLLGVVWNMLWHSASHHHNLISEQIPQTQIRRITREYSVAPVAYGAAIIVAAINAIASVVLIILIAAYFGITVTGGELFPKEQSPTKRPEKTTWCARSHLGG